ncbi:hypothetical protein GCM10017668_65290 [Streptomyces tuirus]|uniref:Uncharacterized protein n=1 Tax=Streptomyces tuirus TaxID=68278 RepID=A0A7G1NSX3_9ACTN|nr:hypothetical protein GCM10017668_65290 [Streptomyces tuirus]
MPAGPEGNTPPGMRAWKPWDWGGRMLMCRVRTDAQLSAPAGGFLTRRPHLEQPVATRHGHSTGLTP